ncbi:MAG: universal stress protein [Rhodocyclaceae bacterium]|nr:MAG: universal stress protein [Rhodocyclaceae bacterium]
MRILLAVDGSEASLRAVQGLVEHVQWFRGHPEIHLLHVHAPIPVGLALTHVSQDTLDRHYREEGEAVLAPAQGLLEAAGLPCTPHIHVGHPAEVIVHQARELGCGLICMGSHGRGAVASAVLGSVAAKVLHLAHIPVMLNR